MNRRSRRGEVPFAARSLEANRCGYPQVVKDLPQIRFQRLRGVCLDGHREVDPDLELGTVPELRKDLRPEAIPYLGRDDAHEPKNSSRSLGGAGRRHRLR